MPINASYHHQLNTEFYPEKKTPARASKGLNARVLRKCGCTKVFIPRIGSAAPGMWFEIPEVEPAAWTAHLDGTGKPPSTGEKGTVYERHSKGGGGPSSDELAAATTAWLNANKPEALNSKVEFVFRSKG